MVSPGPPQSPVVQHFAKEQQKQQSQALCTRQKLKPALSLLQGASKVSAGQDLSGSQLSQGPTRGLQLPLKGPELQALAENPTKSALAGLQRLANAQTTNGMDALPPSNGFGTIFEWMATASWHQMVSPGPPQWRALQVAAARRKRKKQSQARQTQQKLKFAR